MLLQEGLALPASARGTVRLPSVRTSIDDATRELLAHTARAGVQAGFLACISDAISQHMHDMPLDGAHVAAMGAIAFSLSGALNAIWLDHLEAKIPGGEPRAVLSKTVCDYTCCATLFNSAYLFGVPFLTALFSGDAPPLHTLLDGWTVDGFRSAMSFEACTFVPYNLFAFRMVPPALRPTTSALLSATCAIVMSGLTLGYGVYGWS